MFIVYFTDYKRTSLKESLTVFENFLKKLEETWKGKLIEQSGMYNMSDYKDMPAPWTRTEKNNRVSDFVAHCLHLCYAEDVF